MLVCIATAGCDSQPDFDPLREGSASKTAVPADGPLTVGEVGSRSSRALEALQRLHDRSRSRTAPPKSREIGEQTKTQFAERGVDPGALSLRFTTAGTPDNISSPTLAIGAEDLGLPATASRRALADGFVRRFSELWEVSPDAFEKATVTTEDTKRTARTVVHYRQVHDGIPVVGGHVAIHIDTEDPGAPSIIGISGAFLATDGLKSEPAVATAEVVRSVQLEAGEETEPPVLAVWSGSRSGGDPEPRLAWRIPVSTDGNLSRQVFIDAADGDELEIEQLEAGSLQRSLIDMRAQPGAGTYWCQNWSGSASCGSHCDACAMDPAACALCTCANVMDPPNCDELVWRYDETSGCNADGSPAGELDCDAPASSLWFDAEKSYGFWAEAFGRDSWNDAGALMHLISNVPLPPPPTPPMLPPPVYAGQAFPRDLDGDGTTDTVTVAIREGAGNPFLHGHEFGHMLQYGVYTNDGASFYRQGRDAREHNADVHAFRYRDLRLGAGYDCSIAELSHYTRFLSANTVQANKYIGSCHGWLMHKAGGATTYYGVTVTPQSPSVYDQTWFAALDDHFATSHSYFDWWNDIVAGAADVYGFTSPYFTALEARDAIGGWTDFRPVSTGVQPEDRYAAVTIDGDPNTPCVFYRFKDGSLTSRIGYSCRDGAGWTAYADFNDASIDPAASEPAATYRYENGEVVIYVAWAGTDDRIHYRTFEPGTNTIGAPQDMGANHETAGAVAIAPVFESGPEDRIVVVYHPLAHPTWFYSTHIGSTSAGVDMGPLLDSDADPALTPFPYYSRAYFVRPDSMSSATPGRIRYSSYTMAGGWEVATDLTASFETDTFIAAGAVTSDRGVALTAYGRTSDRLRMTWVTPTSAELWYATLSESSPGVLERDGYRAVPLAPTAGAARSAGGLATGSSGSPMFHFSGQGSATEPKLYEWRTYSD